MTELLELVWDYPGVTRVLITGKRKKDIISDKESAFKSVYSLPDRVNNPFDLAEMAYSAVKILLKEKPDFIISAGSEISIIFFYLSKVFSRARLIYIESAAQVNDLSVTGKMIYPIADLFLVQWKSLLGKGYNKSKYSGGLI